MTKVCPTCGIEKPVTEFYKDKTKSNGLFSYCKPCLKVYNRTEKSKARFHRYRISEKGKKTSARYCNSIKGKALIREYQKSPSQRPKRVARLSRRRATKINATPKWLTKEQLQLISMKYQLAAYLTEVTGIRHEVDHIIPLRGKNVSGLHVPWNLRVIPRSENTFKGNRI